MCPRNPLEPRHKLIHPRIVFHRARSQRIHPQIDRVIPRRKPREVPDHFNFADSGQSVHALRAVYRTQQTFPASTAGTSSGGNSNALLPLRRLLKYQSLILTNVPRLLNLLVRPHEFLAGFMPASWVFPSNNQPTPAAGTGVAARTARRKSLDLPRVVAPSRNQARVAQAPDTTSSAQRPPTILRPSNSAFTSFTGSAETPPQIH